MQAGKDVSHEGMVLCFRSCRGLEDIADSLHRLKVARHNADYNLRIGVTAELAAEELDNANALLGLISQIGGAGKVARLLNADLTKTYSPPTS